MSFVYESTQECRELGLRPGDCVLIRPGHEHPIILERDLPLTAKVAIMRLITTGGLVDLLDSRPADESVELVRFMAGLESSGDGVPGRRRPAGAGPRLQLVP
jgi:hypothetical protein